MGDYNDPFNRNNPNVQSRTKAQNRANVLQLKLMGQAHPTGLTTNLLKLFEPRPPLEYKPPPERRKCLPYAGIAQFVSHFAEPGDPEYSPPVIKAETSAERRARIQKLRLEEGARKAAEELEKYDPNKDPNATGDPYKTLFVARLSYEATEHRIKREFETYGPIKRDHTYNELGFKEVIDLETGMGKWEVRLITDKKTNKPRGYAFIEYMHTRDMKTAYKQADGRKLDNRRVLVDVERGRTVPNWRPRRLGGGLGTTRIGGEEASQKQPGREQQQIASGHSRSEEPRRDDRHVDRDREKSRDRGREREREREKSHDRGRDRESRDERHHHHRDRDRNRERERGDREKERDRGRERDHARGREKERDRGRDHDRERDRDRQHERDRERERDYDRTSHERDRGYSYDKETGYGHYESKHEGSRERNFDRDEHDYGQEWYGEPNKHGRKRDHDQLNQSHQGHYNDIPPRGAESEYDREQLSQHGSEYYENATHGKPGTDDYHQQYGYGDAEPREEGEAVGDDYVHHHSERSRTPEYDN